MCNLQDISVVKVNKTLAQIMLMIYQVSVMLIFSLVLVKCTIFNAFKNMLSVSYNLLWTFIRIRRRQNAQQRLLRR